MLVWGWVKGAAVKENAESINIINQLNNKMQKVTIWDIYLGLSDVMLQMTTI